MATEADIKANRQRERDRMEATIAAAFRPIRVSPALRAAADEQDAARKLAWPAKLDAAGQHDHAVWVRRQLAATDTRVARVLAVAANARRAAA